MKCSLFCRYLNFQILFLISEIQGLGIVGFCSSTRMTLPDLGPLLQLKTEVYRSKKFYNEMRVHQCIRKCKIQDCCGVKVNSSAAVTVQKPKAKIPAYLPMILKSGKFGIQVTCDAYKCTNKLQESEISKEREKLVQYFGECGAKRFYLTNTTYTAVNFHTGCCAAGLVPATIDSRMEINCLNQHYIRNTGGQFDMKGKLELYTTISDYSRTRSFVNCPSNTLISDDLWAANEPDNKRGVETCTQLVLCAKCPDVGLADSSCTIYSKVLCQETFMPTTTVPSLASTATSTITRSRTKIVTPAYSKFIVDAIKLSGLTSCKRFQCDNKDAEYINARSKVVAYFGVCGAKEFYITLKEYNSVDYNAGCCKSGLQLAVIESRQELDCLNKLYTNNNGTKGELQIFTSIGDFSRTRRFVNCPSDQTIAEELWAYGEPDNKKGMEICAQLVICADCDRSGMYDVPCTLNGKSLCQRNITTTTTEAPFTTQILLNPLRYGPPYSEKNKRKLKEQTDCKGRTKSCLPKKVPTDKSKLISYAKGSSFLFLNECNGKMFFISKAKVMSSWSTCCQAGLIPADIKSKTELDCIRANANTVTGLKSDVTAFTVHRDKYFNRTFMSCLDNSIVPDDLWIKGQPDNKGGTQVCALVNVCSDCPEPGFSDVDCNLIDMALCQNRV